MGPDIVNFVYLDHNATTPVRPEAVAAVADALGRCGNPSSVHRWGRTARAQLADLRTAVARAVGLPPGGQIVFTSGGTEANALALRGDPTRPVMVSAIEHDSVRAARSDAIVIPVLPSGRIDLDGFQALLDACEIPPLISVMAANNETGVIQPMADIVARARAAGALVHCDAAQAIGKIPFSMAELGLDLVSVSAHKFGGPPGVGALAISERVQLTSVQKGGGQERGLRAGTENLPGIAGMAAAITFAIAELGRYAAIAALRDALERRIHAIAPDAVIFGEEVPRLPNTTCVALPGVAADLQVMSLDLARIGVSAGAACSSGKVRPSHVIEAMGFDAAFAGSAIRISLGTTTQETELDRLCDAWALLADRVQAQRVPA